MRNGPVLLVEDDPEARVAMAATLREAGYEVVEAGDGTAALRLAGSASPALIVLDLILPDVAGFDLLAELRRLPGCTRLPIIAISGFVERTDDAMAAGEEFTAYLLKPLGSKQLLAAVADSLTGATTTRP